MQYIYWKPLRQYLGEKTYIAFFNSVEKDRFFERHKLLKLSRKKWIT